MAIQLVNVGALPNDGEGDPLRVAFQKINNNFVYLQNTASQISSAVTLDNSPSQTVWEYPTATFTQAVIQIQSYREDTLDSQNALLGVQIYNDLSNVKFTCYGTTNVGDWLVTYGMDVVDDNVRLLVSPLVNEVIQHFISYQVTWTGDLGVGVGLMTQSDGSLVTETANVVITTEG